MADPTPLSLYVGLDVGGTNVQGVGLAGGQTLARKTVSTVGQEGPERGAERMADLVRALLLEAAQETAQSVDLGGVGVGLPGLVDRISGTTGFLPNLPDSWWNFPLAPELSKVLCAPCYLLNDARMAALGELHFGLGRELGENPSLVLLTLGTGLGGGVVLDGRLRLGPLGAAGELGHQLFDPAGLLCGCGARGCIETVATAPALVAEGVRLLLSNQAPALSELTGGDGGRVTPIVMGEAAAQDASVALAIERVGEALGVAASNALVALHPDAIVFCGGLSRLGDPLLDAIRATVEQRVKVFPPAGVRIEISALGSRAGALGGAALARSAGRV